MAIDKPPDILGGMIGSALVGTFLGVLLAYGLVGPFSNRAKQIIESDAAIYQTVKQIIIASAPRPSAAFGHRSGMVGDRTFKPAKLCRSVRRYERPLMAAKLAEPIRPIIVKKIIVEAHAGLHGGARKVAYADFVTAMMAFFLLM